MHMGHAPPSPELAEYIERFRENASKQLRKGNISMIMLYSDTCPVCHMQFNHFKNFMGVTLDKQMDGKSVKKKEEITDKILPMELEKDPDGRKLITESEEWSRKIKDPEAKIKFTPTFIDAQTHEIRLTGFVTENVLRDKLKDKNLDRKRKEFKEIFSNRLNQECDKVACGLKSSFTIEPPRESDGKKKDKAKKENPSKERKKKEEIPLEKKKPGKNK